MKVASRPPRDEWVALRVQWVTNVGIGAADVTACDALLLQRSKNDFTGGFLSVDSSKDPSTSRFSPPRRFS